MADAAQLASLADETPEGRSVVVLAKNFGIRARELSEMVAVGRKSWYRPGSACAVRLCRTVPIVPYPRRSSGQAATTGFAICGFPPISVFGFNGIKYTDEPYAS